MVPNFLQAQEQVPDINVFAASYCDYDPLKMTLSWTQLSFSYHSVLPTP